jgi:hypothetical protein
VTALAFSPDHRILVSAVGFDEDGTDTIWDVADATPPSASDLSSTALARPA